MLIWLTVVVAIAAARCTNDEDCNLNGICANRSCLCAPEWRGSTCGELNLLPAKPRPHSGYDEAGNSSWGGSIVEYNGTNAPASVCVRM